MFENLKKALHEEYESNSAAVSFYVENGYMPTWAEENRKNPDAGLERHSTPAKWYAYKSGTITREKAVKLATARALRAEEKILVSRLEKLERIASAPDLEFITINVEWKRSRTWGYNPTADVVTNEYARYTGTASGCGYDKRSAAVACALNASPAVLKALYIAANAALGSGQAFTRLNVNTVTWRDVLGYGSGYSVLPYFEGGVGISCFEKIFSSCGYNFHEVASGKYFDSYTVSRKEAE